MPSITSCSYPVRTALILTISLATASWTGHAARQRLPGAAPRSLAAASPQDAQLLVGTWELIDFSRALDGRVTAPWGSQAVGRITYDADGHVTALLMHEQRNEANGRPSSPDVQSAFSAYFGTYTVDTAKRIVTHQVGASLSAERASGELRRNYQFKDGMLILTFTRPQDGATNTLKWKRISRLNP